MKRFFKILLFLILALLLVVAGYAIYVFTAYDRIPDNQPLEVHAGEEDVLTTGSVHRLLSYNLGFGAYSDDFSFFMDGGRESRARSEEAVRENITGAMEAVKAANADLILCQEVDLDSDRSHHVDETELVRQSHPDFTWIYTQNYDSPYLFWPLTCPHGANKAGLMTMSRYPVTSALRRQLPIDPGPMKIVDLDRCYSVNRIPVGDRELVLYNVHLSAYTKDTSVADNQLKMLFADMCAELEQGNYAIAGGDFNKDLLGNSPEIFGMSAVGANWAQPIPEELIPDQLRLVAPLNPDDPVASCRNADRPYGPDDLVLTVDGFVVSENVRVLESRVLDEGFRWSDHNPVYLDFVLEE